jgi:hypothetical protein
MLCQPLGLPRDSSVGGHSPLAASSPLAPLCSWRRAERSGSGIAAGWDTAGTCWMIGVCCELSQLSSNCVCVVVEMQLLTLMSLCCASAGAG